MSTGVITWSQTAATNATADSSVNWAEGMAPSAVNDSARATMASVAKWRDDLNGSITTTGTSTAYAVTSNQVEGALTAGYLVAFCPHTTNAATVTLNVDGLGAKPLRSAPGVELSAGVIVQGTPYVATYYTTNSGEWILHGFYGNPYSTPIGGMMAYVGSSAPNSNFVLPYGQAISRTTYSALFALTSTSFGTGDGSTTFNVPDLRGRIPVGLDNMGGTAANRITSGGSGVTGTTMGATGGEEAHTLSTPEMPAHNHTYADPGHTHSITLNSTAPTGAGSEGGASGATVNISTAAAFVGISINNTGGGGAHNNVQPCVVVPWILRVI